jgi:hypothetical protein
MDILILNGYRDTENTSTNALRMVMKTEKVLLLIYVNFNLIFK